MVAAPIPGAQRSKPSPQGPVIRISLAYTGSSATAPPSSTANRSSEIDPRLNFARHMYRKPASTLLVLIGSRDLAFNCTLISKAQNVATIAEHAAKAYTAAGPRATA